MLIRDDSNNGGSISPSTVLRDSSIDGSHKKSLSCMYESFQLRK